MDTNSRLSQMALYYEVAEMAGYLGGLTMKKDPGRMTIIYGQTTTLLRCGAVKANIGHGEGVSPQPSSSAIQFPLPWKTS